MTLKTRSLIIINMTLVWSIIRAARTVPKLRHVWIGCTWPSLVCHLPRRFDVAHAHLDVLSKDLLSQVPNKLEITTLEVMSAELDLPSWSHMRYHWFSVYGSAHAVQPRVMSSYRGLYTPTIVLTADVRAKQRYSLCHKCGKFLNDAYDTYELNFSSFGWSAQSAPYTFKQA